MPKIIGDTVGIPNPQPDWNQTDQTKADYIKNKPLYLTDFFKEIPEGKSIDDLEGEEFTGCYILFNPRHNGYTGLLYVGFGTYSNNEVQTDIPCTYQTRYFHNSFSDGSEHTVKIETRNNAYGWSDWEDVYASKTGENEYFKILPDDADINALVEEGKYIVNKRINDADYIETITVRWGVKKYEDLDSEYQTIYQVKECFGSNGYQMLIRDRVSDYQWSEWQDCFGTGGGGGELETIATVNIEEEVNDITITADSQGNPFELEELFAYIQIPTVTDGIQPIIYFGSENNCNRTLDNLTVDSSIVIKWKREEMVAEFQVYNYGTNKFKSLTILKVSDTNIVNKLRLYHKTKLYPIGTSIVLKGKKVRK